MNRFGSVLPPFFQGRHVVAAVMISIAASVGSFLLWKDGLVIGDAGVSAQEMFGGAFGLMAAWCLNPKMASWEQTSPPPLRRLSAACAAVAMLVAWAIPHFGQIAVTELPSAWVTGQREYDLTDFNRAVVAPRGTNAAIVTAIAFLAVPLLGKVAGLMVSLAAWIGLVILAITTSIPNPYYVRQLGTEEIVDARVPAAALVAVAALVWLRTGGSTLRSRRFDA